MPVRGAGPGVEVLLLPRSSLTRLQGVIARRGGGALATRICSARELQAFRELQSKAGPQENVMTLEERFLASRWTIKEAAYKAVAGHYTPTWKDLDLSYTAHGKPLLHWVSEPKNDMFDGFHVTISHDAGVVVAAVIAEGTRAR